MAKKRKWNISRAASFQSQAERCNRGRKRESLMVPISCLVLRGGLAVAVAVLASSLSGTIAVAQQIAVNVEGQAAQEASPDEEQPDDAYARQIVPFHTSEAPERSSSIRVNAISTSSSRTIGQSAMASGSGASVSNGRASSGCPRNKSGPTGACQRR